MIWWCFVSNKLGPIVFIDGSIKSDRYISILDDHFLLYLDTLTHDGITGITFQQDNTQPHTSKITPAFLDNDTTQVYCRAGLASIFPQHELN